MKSLNSPQYQDLRSMAIVPLLELFAPSGTLYLSDRTWDQDGNTYQPKVLAWGVVKTKVKPVTEAQVHFRRMTVKMDNRARFAGAPSRLSEGFTGFEPEGSPFRVRLVDLDDPGLVDVLLEGKVANTPNLAGDTFELDLAGWLAYKNGEERLNFIERDDYPAARDVKWFFGQRRTAYTQTIPLRYGLEFENEPAIATRQAADRLREVIPQVVWGGINISIYRPEIWQKGGGYGIMGGSSTAWTKFQYLGVDEVNRQLTICHNQIDCSPATDFPSLSSPIAVVPLEDSRPVGLFNWNNATVRSAGFGPALQTAQNAQDFGITEGDVDYLGATSEFRWNQEPSGEPTDILINGLPTDGVLNEYGRFWDGETLRFPASPLGTGDEGVYQDYEQFVTGTPTFPELHDGSLATAKQFGAAGQNAAGLWSLSSEAGYPTGNPWDVSWTDKLEGSFSCAAREIMTAPDRNWNVDGFGDNLLMELALATLVLGTNTINDLWLLLHFYSTTGHTGSSNHVWGSVRLNGTPSMLGGVLNTLWSRLRFSGAQSQDDLPQFSNAVDANSAFFPSLIPPRFKVNCDYCFGMDQTGAGTDSQVNVYMFNRVAWRTRGGQDSQEQGPISNTDPTPNVEDICTADITGIVDDPSGTFTGTPDAVIDNPADVRRHYIQTAGVPEANIDVASFQADRSRYEAPTPETKGYRFRGRVDLNQSFGSVLSGMDFAARARSLEVGGLVTSFYREDRDALPAAVKALTPNELSAINPSTPKRQLVGFPESFRIGVGTMRTSIPVYSGVVTAPPQVSPGAGGLLTGYPDLEGIPPGSVRLSEPTDMSAGSVDPSVNAFGPRRKAEVPQEVTWLDSPEIVTALAAFYLSWANQALLVLEPLRVYWDQYALDPGDVITLEWIDQDGTPLDPALDGATKLLVVGTPTVELPAPGKIGHVGLVVIQAEDK